MLDEEFPGSRVVRTWFFPCRHPDSLPAQGNRDPTSQAAWPKLPQNNKNKTKTIIMPDGNK